jgi:hypothetical protein
MQGTTPVYHLRAWAAIWKSSGDVRVDSGSSGASDKKHVKLFWRILSTRKRNVVHLRATWPFGDMPRRMLKVIQRCGNQCICHLQDKHYASSVFFTNSVTAISNAFRNKQVYYYLSYNSMRLTFSEDISSTFNSL